MYASQLPDPTQADRGYVYAVARRILRDDDEAQDVAQDALLLAHRRRSQFRGEASYRTWLHRIAVSCAITSLRRRRASRRTLDAFAAYAYASRSIGELADERLDRRREHARLAGAIAALDPMYRRVLELRVGEDRSEQEIARALEISIPAVKVRAFRARNMLRQALPAAA